MTYTIEQICRVTHAANSALTQVNGEKPYPAWDEAPAWMRQSSARSVQETLEGGNDPRYDHEQWFKERTKQGWVYGPIRDEATKTSPHLIPYDDLPFAQLVKDLIRAAIAKAMTSS